MCVFICSRKKKGERRGKKMYVKKKEISKEKFRKFVSYNAQSQEPHIPVSSSHTVLSQYSSSLQVQAKFPDIHLLSLCVSTEEILASVNTQDQDPDDPHTQDHQCAPCDFVENPRHYSQAQSKVPDIHLLTLCEFMEEFSASFNTQDQAPDDPHVQVLRCVPYDFVENPRHYRQGLARLLTKHDIPHLFLQLVSYDSTQQLSTDSIC